MAGNQAFAATEIRIDILRVPIMLGCYVLLPLIIAAFLFSRFAAFVGGAGQSSWAGTAAYSYPDYRPRLLDIEQTAAKGDLQL